MIELITGIPGSGKTYMSVKLITRSILAGRVVVTNVPLVDDWAERLAGVGWHKFRDESKVAARAARFRRLLYFSESLDDLLRVRVEGDAEGRADMVLDECHRWLNSRMWNAGVGRSASEATVERQRLVEFFSAHRHYGYDVYLLTQHQENVDRQIRRLFEYLVTLKNLKRAKILGIPWCPINMFVMNRVWNDNVKSRVSSNVFGLDKTLANLYRTHALHATDMPADAILMPRRDVGELGGAAPGPLGPSAVRLAPRTMQEHPWHV